MSLANITPEGRVQVDMSLEDAAYITAMLGQTGDATSYKLFSDLADLADDNKFARLQPIRGYGTGELFPSSKEHFQVKL